MAPPSIRTADDPTEGLLFCTIRVTAEQSTGLSVGTGFFFKFAESADGGECPAIVTNRHVIGDAERVTLRFRAARPDLSGPLLGKSLQLTIADAHKSVIGHPDPSVDLCILPLTRVIKHLNDQGATPWFGCLDIAALERPPTPPRAIEDVLMVGYPAGLWDDVNDMPLVRRGITATHAALNWKGRDEFLVDMACFPGSSGSPVFLVHQRRLAKPLPSGHDSVTHYPLLGILYAGPQHRAEGTIEIREAPTAIAPFTATEIPMNLGVVIKSEKLKDLDALIREQVAAGTFRDYAGRTARGADEDSSHVPSFLWRRVEKAPE